MPYRPAQIWTGTAWDDIGDSRVGVQEINTQTANYTLVLGDIAKRVQMNNSAARTITIPPNSSVAFPVGTRLDIANINTGVLTIAGGSGVTVNGRALTLGQWETATVVQRAANTWVVEPQANLTAALGSKLDVTAPVGKILQVVNAETTTSALNNSTTTYADTNLSATITPTSATSKVLVVVSQTYRLFGANDQAGSIKLVRGSTDIWLPGQNFYLASGVDMRAVFSLNYLDSPNTTNATTYKTQFNRHANTIEMQPNSQRSNITLIEVGQ
jgi:hypothetical protein